MRASTLGLPVRFENVSVLKKDLTILDAITLEIKAGAPTSVMGPNGSGKTTMLRTAMGLEVPDKGKVIWGRTDHPPPNSQAFVFQRPVMLRRTAAGNLRYALRVAAAPKAHEEARIGELLALVGLQALAGRPARRLSGGGQQRLAIARALALSPTILFLDEPTASLDPASTKAIEDIIRTIAASGIKVVMSTHDLGQARRIAAEIILLHRGRVIESANAAQFFNAPVTREASRFIAGELLV
jgi:tungstate transport system ATP-binding protein